MDEMKKKFGERLREQRSNKGLSLEKLSDLLKSRGINISKDGLSLYELGKREPPVKIIITLAEYFNVSTDYLFGITDKQELTTDGKIINLTVENVWQEACINYLKNLFDSTQADELLPVLESLNNLVEAKFSELRYTTEINKRFIEYKMVRNNAEDRTSYFENATSSPKPPEESVNVCKHLFLNSVARYINELSAE